MNRGLSQYLRCYAEPEANIAESLTTAFSVALVVPLHREKASCIEGYVSALQRCSVQPLLILVVNSAIDTSHAAQLDTEQLLGELLALAGAQELPALGAPDDSTPCFLGVAGGVAILVVDRCTAGHCLPAKSGAGLARKIGNDIAVGLFEHGRLRSRVVFQTDGDVTLPDDYFVYLNDIEPAPAPVKSAVSAWVIPFIHEEGEVHAEYLATLHYEIRLRYHLFGLRYADCSYAWHSLGSAMAVEIYHYAATRGFPKRPAGEDFYLLNKLSKLGAVHSYPSSPVRIRARESNRVPFGTGPAVQYLLEHPAKLHDFRIFDVLRRSNVALAAFAEGAGAQDLQSYFVAANDGRVNETATTAREWQVAEAAWESLGVWSSLARAVRGACPGPIRARRVRDCFDALKTLRYLHILRDQLYPDVPWQVAIEAFPGPNVSLVAGDTECATLEKVRRRLLDAERDWPL